MLKGFVSGEEKDIKRIPMKGKNLFDGTKYAKTSLANNDMWLYSDSFSESVYRIPCKPNTTYTLYLTENVDITVWRIRDVSTDSVPSSTSSSVLVDGSHADSVPSNRRTTFSTSQNAKYILFQTNESSYSSVLSCVMLVEGSQPLPYEPYGMQQGWEVRDQQGTIIWGADKTLTGTDSISFKGYGLPLKSYEIEANMEQAASQQYSIAGTDSVTYQSDGTSIALQIVGNETQTGTPTPTVPITPEECGERTANVYDKTNPNVVRAYYKSQTNEIAANENNAFVYVPIEEGMTYYISGAKRYNQSTPIRYCTTSQIPAHGVSVVRTGSFSHSDVFTITAQSGESYLAIFLCGDGDYSAYGSVNGAITANSENMVIDNGYKITITNGNTTYNVYLTEPLRKIGDYGDTISSDGTVTRNIRKLVLTGEETWINAGGNAPYRTMLSDIVSTTDRNIVLFLSSHYLAVSNNTSWAQYNTCVSWAFSSDNINVKCLQFRDTNQATVTDFKTFLASEYSAGHPVEVWYVLETAQTGTATFPTITPTQGSNTLAVNTTLAPSAITLTATSGVWPANPIEPDEFGEPTVNLLDEQAYFTNRAVLQETSNYVVTINAKPNTSYTLSTNIPYVPYNDSMVAQLFLSTGTYVGPTTGSNGAGDGIPRTITTDSTGLLYVITRGPESVIAPISYAQYLTNGYWMSLVEGSFPIPYEPYGKYKIPITNAGTTYNIFLTEPLRKIEDYGDTVASDGTTVRRIKKVVFTGQETWTEVYPGEPEAQAQGIVMYATSLSEIGTDRNDFRCSHFFVGNYRGYLISGQGRLNGTSPEAFNVNYNNGSGGLQNFKQWLADEYAAGHPVEVWYVLATITTETITAPTISTIEGTNTIEVDTTLSPSKIDITLHGKYAMWNAIRNDIRNGTAPTKYPIGTILYDSLTDGTGTAFQVVGYDKHFDPSLTAQGYTHSMTLCEYKLTGVYVFDNIEAFIYTNQILTAGTYKFTIPNYDATYGGNKTYYFTSTADLPKNSQIVLKWDYQKPPASVTAYSPTSSITAMENTTATTGWSSLTLTEYVDGESPAATDLGTIAGPTTQAGTSNYGEMNHIHRARYGSNNYLQSGLRQYLNASTDANTWWKPQTIFDRPYSQRNQAGKLSKLNQNLVSVLATPTIQSRTNSYFETTSLDGTTFTVNTNYDITTDKLFLLSPMEVGFNTTDTTVGTLLDYYIAGTSTDANNKRIKYRADNNNAYYWWLRTPYPPYASIFRNVNSSGALSNNTAYSSFGAVPACVIQ